MKSLYQILMLSVIAMSTVAVASAPSSHFGHRQTVSLRNTAPIGDEFLSGNRIHGWVFICSTGSWIVKVYRDGPTCEAECTNACRAEWRP